MSRIRWLPACALLLSACAPVRSAAPLHDFIVIGNSDGLAAVDFATARQAYASTAAVASPDWSSLFVANAGQLERLDAHTGAVLDTREVPAGMQPVAVSTDGMRVALAPPEEASTWPPLGRETPRIAVSHTPTKTPPR